LGRRKLGSQQDKRSRGIHLTSRIGKYGGSSSRDTLLWPEKKELICLKMPVNKSPEFFSKSIKESLLRADIVKKRRTGRTKSLGAGTGYGGGKRLFRPSRGEFADNNLNLG